MGGRASNHFATYPITKKTTAQTTRTNRPTGQQQHYHFYTYVFNYRFIYSTLDGSLQLMKISCFIKPLILTLTLILLLMHRHTHTLCMWQWNALKIHCYYYYRFNFSSCIALISSSSVRDEEEYQCSFGFSILACILRTFCVHFATMQCVKSIKSLHTIGTAIRCIV